MFGRLRTNCRSVAKAPSCSGERRPFTAPPQPARLQQVARPRERGHFRRAVEAAANADRAHAGNGPPARYRIAARTRGKPASRYRATRPQAIFRKRRNCFRRHRAIHSRGKPRYLFHPHPFFARCRAESSPGRIFLPIRLDRAPPLPCDRYLFTLLLGQILPILPALALPLRLPLQGPEYPAQLHKSHLRLPASSSLTKTDNRDNYLRDAISLFRSRRRSPIRHFRHATLDMGESFPEPEASATQDPDYAARAKAKAL